MSHRDRIAAILTSGNLSPEEKQILQGGAAPALSPEQQKQMAYDAELEQWKQQMGEQMPSQQRGPMVLRNDAPGAVPGLKPEGMPLVFGGEQTAKMPNYGQEVPPRDMGSVEYPMTPEPAFEGQLSGEVPMTW